MPKFVNRARMTTATTGTGAITLGAATAGFQTFAAAGVVDGNQLRYVIEDGTAWEIGLGIYTAAGTLLSRGLSASSTGALIALSGAAVVFVGAAAADAVWVGDAIALPDNTNLTIGTTANVVLRHNGTDGFLDVSSGALNLRGRVNIQNTAGTETVALFIPDDGTYFYFNNLAKLWTTISGVEVFGSLVISGTVDGREVSVDGTKLDGIASGANLYAHPNHSGDVTSVADGATTIATNAVTNAKAADMATATIKGRVTAATGDPEDLTGTQATTLLDVFTTANKGLVPAPVTTNTTDFLRRDGAWSPLTANRTFGQLAANYTLTSATTVQKLFNWSTNGALTLATGRYQFRAVIYVTGMSATAGNAAFSLAGTATLADRIINALGVDSSTPLSAGAIDGSATITSATVASMIPAGVGTGMFVEIGGMFNVTVGGTIIPSIQLVTAAAAIVQAGSYFECVRIADTGVTTLGTWT